MRLVLALVMLLASTSINDAYAQASCTKADFEAVVDDASAALRELTAANKPTFQEKLRQLKDKRGWSHDRFMLEATPFVQDERITEFDRRSADHLDRISSLGSEGASAKTPDCKLLATVKESMTGLVEAQKGKWSYMFEKLGAELAR